MADMTIPATWTKYSVSADEVTYIRDGHTDDVPLLVKFKRRPFNGGTSSFQVLWVAGNSDQVEDEQRNTLVDLNVRNVAGQLTTRVDTIFAELAVLAADAGFVDDATETLSIPI
jgi:hypothetical protein